MNSHYLQSLAGLLYPFPTSLTHEQVCFKQLQAGALELAHCVGINYVFGWMTKLFDRPPYGKASVID